MYLVNIFSKSTTWIQKVRPNEAFKESSTHLNRKVYIQMGNIVSYSTPFFLKYAMYMNARFVCPRIKNIANNYCNIILVLWIKSVSNTSSNTNMNLLEFIKRRRSLFRLSSNYWFKKALKPMRGFRRLNGWEKREKGKPRVSNNPLSDFDLFPVCIIITPAV